MFYHHPLFYMLSFSFFFHWLCSAPPPPYPHSPSSPPPLSIPISLTNPCRLLWNAEIGFPFCLFVFVLFCFICCLLCGTWLEGIEKSNHLMTLFVCMQLLCWLVISWFVHWLLLVLSLSRRLVVILGWLKCHNLRHVPVCNKTTRMYLYNNSGTAVIVVS